MILCAKNLHCHVVSCVVSLAAFSGASHANHIALTETYILIDLSVIQILTDSCFGAGQDIKRAFLFSVIQEAIIYISKHKITSK